jgi:peptidoglycan/xylan/chitin deacetylase (PgdA/CDA1 family)
VVITFDDGYVDNDALAYPILRHHSFVATIFPVTGAMGGANTWDQDGDLAGRPIISPTAIRAMARGGISFGAHTRTHPILSTLQEDRAIEEIDGSRRDLECELAGQASTFAYPYGQCTPEIEALVRQAGFAGAVGIREGLNGPATSPFSLRRTEIRGTDSLLRFALALWLGVRQWTLTGQ